MLSDSLASCHSQIGLERSHPWRHGSAMVQILRSQKNPISQIIPQIRLQMILLDPQRSINERGLLLYDRQHQLNVNNAVNDKHDGRKIRAPTIITAETPTIIPTVIPIIAGTNTSIIPIILPVI